MLNSDIIETVLNEILSELQKSNNLSDQVVRQNLEILQMIGDFDRRLAELQIVIPPADLHPLQQLITEISEKTAVLAAARTESLSSLLSDFHNSTKDSLNKTLAAGLEKINDSLSGSLIKINDTLSDSLTKTNQSLSSSLTMINDTLAAKPQPIVRQFRLAIFPQNDPDGVYRFFLTRVLGWLTILLILFKCFSLAREYIILSAVPTTIPISPLPAPSPTTPSAPHHYSLHPKHPADPTP